MSTATHARTVTLQHTLELSLTNPIDDSFDESYTAEARDTLENLREVTEKEFFATVGQMDVHPHILPSIYPWSSSFRTRRDGREMGRIVTHVPEGKALPESRYFTTPT